MKDYTTYQNPLTGRYASKEMSYNFSPQRKHSTWRRLWLALAESEKALGLAITDEQLDEMRAHLDDIDFEEAERIEAEVRHDVMSHIRTFGEVCPKAKGIIHLGATSCFVTDNTELIQMRDGMKILRGKLLDLIDNLAKFAAEYKSMPMLGFTHFQPAQLTTLGKRFSLYIQDFMFDLAALDRAIDELPFRGAKGTTGTQASYLDLFGGELREVVDQVQQLRAQDLHAVAHLDKLGVVGHETARRAEVDDAFRLRADLAERADVAHHVVADLRLDALRFLEVDVVEVGAHFVELFVGDRKSERLFALGEREPETPPGGVLPLGREVVAHFLACVTSGQGVLIGRVILHSANLSWGIRVFYNLWF